MKTCTKCQLEKPFESFPKKSASKDGFHARCKECMRAYSRKWAKANPEKKRKSQRKFLEGDSEKLKEYHRLQYKANAEKKRAYARKYYSENSEARRSYAKANAPSRKIASQKYRERNPHIKIALNAKRRAAKLKATPAWANQEKIDEFYFAADFLGMVTGEWYHVDHVVPLQSDVVCGLHWEGNLQVLTAAENARKGNSIWPDMPSRRLL